MTLACGDLPPLLAAEPLGVLDAAELRALQEHLQGCGSCKSIEAEIKAALATATPATMTPPDATWQKLKARIAADRAAPAVTPVRVVLSCTFCHEALEREHAAFCGSCLAPHHEECFSSHGRCAAPGCSETRTVRPRELARPSAELPPRAGTRPPRGLVRLLVVSGIAAFGVIHSTAPRAAPLEPSSLSSESPRARPRPSPLLGGREIQKVLEQDPRDPPTLVALARLRADQGDLDLAEEALLEAGRCGANPVREVWGESAASELAPLRARPGFFEKAARAAPRLSRDRGRDWRDPFVAPPKPRMNVLVVDAPTNALKTLRESIEVASSRAFFDFAADLLPRDARLLVEVVNRVEDGHVFLEEIRLTVSKSDSDDDRSARLPVLGGERPLRAGEGGRLTVEPIERTLHLDEERLKADVSVAVTRLVLGLRDDKR